MVNKEVRPSPIAGRWYSGEASRLKQEIDQYIQQAVLPELDGEVVAIAAPHAGYIYSGATAGHAFRTVLGESFDLVAVVSPYHQFHPNALLTTAHQAYQTPLGQITVSQEGIRKLDEFLQTNNGERLHPIAKDQEHSLEIELPFLQCALSGEFDLLPVMISGFEPGLAVTVGQGLADIFKGKRGLLVASTDLSHFHPEETANILDTTILDAIARFSTDEVILSHRSGKGQACGVMAVLAVMVTAKELGATHAKVLHYSTSGETSGDFGSVVGYGAVAFLKKDQ